MSGAEAQPPVPALAKMSLNENSTVSADGAGQQSAKPAEQIVNPFEVVAADERGVDYDKLVETFGTRKIDQAIGPIREVDRKETSSLLTPRVILQSKVIARLTVDLIIGISEEFWIDMRRGSPSFYTPGAVHQVIPCTLAMSYHSHSQSLSRLYKVY
jgi:hypothetical protein